MCVSVLTGWKTTLQKGFGSTSGHQAQHEQQRAFEAKDTNGFLGCIRKALVTAQKDDPSPLLWGVTYL